MNAIRFTSSHWTQMLPTRGGEEEATRMYIVLEYMSHKILYCFYYLIVIHLFLGRALSSCPLFFTTCFPIAFFPVSCLFPRALQLCRWSIVVNLKGMRKCTQNNILPRNLLYLFIYLHDRNNMGSSYLEQVYTYSRKWWHASGCFFLLGELSRFQEDFSEVVVKKVN